MLHIKIPASTSNLGAGFDVIGLALNMYLDIRVEALTGGRNEWRFHGEGRGSVLAESPDNFIIKTLNTVLKKRGVENPGFGIRVRNQIPLSRGLGSSGTAIIAGVIIANYLGKLGMTRDDILTEAVNLEGHPDNVCPSMLGGLMSVLQTENNGIKWIRQRFPKRISLVFVIPDYHVSTKKSRSLLPKAYRLKDITYNMQRVSMLFETIRTRDYELLSHLLEDRLHQRFRAPCIPGMEKVLSIGPGNGLIGLYLSGSGPTVCAFADGNGENIAKRISGIFEDENIAVKTSIIKADNKGVRIVEE